MSSDTDLTYCDPGGSDGADGGFGRNPGNLVRVRVNMRVRMRVRVRVRVPQ